MKKISFNGLERRIYKRIPKNFTVKFRIRKRENLKVGHSDWPIGILENLSAGGALFKYNRDLPLNSLIDFRIRSPISRAPIECRGKVVRVEPIINASIARIGIAFVKITGQNKRIINEFADDFYKVNNT
ncbi:MAG: PilZ domain-containing protein [Candidatus Omnitrophica bacterium]|nr:PilZ domain-containing protein [Candidatus Omnitrophota bacterium]